MNTTAISTSLPEAVATSLHKCGFFPFFGTPCGILAPLYSQLQQRVGLSTIAREDNAVGVAAGSALCGRSPVVLMQNSGFGQSVNAIASLVTPYRIAMLFIISLRGVDQDLTEENRVMGRATAPMLAALDIPTAYLDGDQPANQIEWSHRLVVERRRPAALLVTPALFGWRP